MTKPLAGMLFCCTAIPSSQREVIASHIKTLGGVHYSDLMSDVNYLIVGDRNTDKYNYCIRNRFDVAFLRPDAIDKVYAAWINGDDVSLDQHRLNIFENMLVCLSRISDDTSQPRLQDASAPRHRQLADLKNIYKPHGLSEMIVGHGGKVTESLTQANAVVVTTERSGKRYDKAVEWHIPVVHPVYVFDLIARGASLVPKDYLLDVTDNGSPNGCNVWDKLKSRKRPHDDDDRVVKKSTTVWDLIMANAKGVRAESVVDDAWREDDDDVPPPPQAVVASVQATTAKGKPLLGGLRFHALGFTASELALLTKAITTHGGQVDASQDECITHVIVPFKNGLQLATMLRMLTAPLKHRIHEGSVPVVTEWFVERSIYYHKVCHDLWAQPVRGLIKCKRPFKICITGFTGIELLHITKLIEAVGFDFCDSLASNRDLLIININLFRHVLVKNSPRLYLYKHKTIIDCPTVSGSTSVQLISAKNKINAAKQWNIPIVSIAYLWEMLDKSTGKDELVFPDIMDLQWCLFAPMDNVRPNTLLDYARGNDTTQSHDKVQLPSPRKTKDKQKYGRLVGNSAESLTSKLMSARDDRDQDHDVTLNEDDPPTQVGYENTNSMKNNEELLRKLEPKPRRSRRD